MNEEACDLSDVSYLVLDEADRMLDQGFERDVRKIIAATHVDRQTCLFSATWPDSVRELAHEFLKNPLKITIGSDDLTAAATIEQIVEVFDDERLRQGKLVKLLKNHKETGKADSIYNFFPLAIKVRFSECFSKIPKKISEKNLNAMQK